MTVFFTEKDRRFMEVRQASFYNEALPRIRVYFPKETIPDDFVSIYRESRIDDLLENYDSHLIPAHILMDPPESDLKEIGVEEPRNIKISFSKKILEEGRALETGGPKVPYPEPDTGCVVMVEERFFFLTEKRPKAYYGNAEKNFQIILWGIKHNPSSIEEGEKVEPGTDPPPIEFVW